MMTLDEAAVSLKEKLSNIPEVWSVGIGEDCIVVYASTMKVWVDVPPIFPKGPNGYRLEDGYRVDVVCQKPPTVRAASKSTNNK